MEKIAAMLAETGIPFAYDHFAEGESPEAERRLEAVLDAHGIFYNKSEVWIDSEKLYEVLYSFCLSIQSEAPVGLHGVEMEGLNDGEKEE